MPPQQGCTAAPKTPAKPTPPVVSVAAPPGAPAGLNRGRLCRSRGLRQRSSLQARSGHRVEAAGRPVVAKAPLERFLRALSSRLFRLPSR